MQEFIQFNKAWRKLIIHFLILLKIKKLTILIRNILNKINGLCNFTINILEEKNIQNQIESETFKKNENKEYYRLLNESDNDYRDRISLFVTKSKYNA